MSARLFVAAGLLLGGCTALPPSEPSEITLTYLTRGTPSAALDSAAAWAARSDDLIAERAGATLTIRDRRRGQDNVATLAAERRSDRVAEVTVRNRYVLARDFRDLAVAMAMGSLGGPRYLVPLADSDAAQAPCFSLDDWLAGEDPYPVLDADGDGEERPPVLVGGLAAMQRRADYPAELRRQGVSGVVLVEFVVGETGAVECAQAISSPHPGLTSATLAAVRASVFEPGTVGGEPVRVRFMVPMTFRVH